MKVTVWLFELPEHNECTARISGEAQTVRRVEYNNLPLYPDTREGIQRAPHVFKVQNAFVEDNTLKMFTENSR